MRVFIFLVMELGSGVKPSMLMVVDATTLEPLFRYIVADFTGFPLL